MMLGGVLGMDVPLAVQLIIGVVIIAGMVGAIAWVINRSGTHRLGARITRGHRSHLAVVDAAVVDERRRLILVRRDNTEHLMMVGGPNDLVIEANIAPGTTPHRVQASSSDAALPPDERFAEGTPLRSRPEPAPSQLRRPEPTPRLPEQMLRPEPQQAPAPQPSARNERAPARGVFHATHGRSAR